MKRILLVEDFEDTRAMIALALEAQGHRVTTAADGLSGLARLREERFDLVISDYDMPGLTGTRMLAQARAEGILNGAQAVVLTAHPAPEAADAWPVLRKPLDLDVLLTLAGDGRARAPRITPAPGLAADFVLYVSRGTRASITAEANLRRLLTRCAPGTVRLDVLDVAARAADAERDRVVLTPTLVRRAPAPRVWIVGDLRDDRPVRDLLESCGIPLPPA